MFRVRWCVCLIPLCLAPAPSAFAQVTTADIVGRVTDASGGVLPGATVTVEQRRRRTTSAPRPTSDVGRLRVQPAADRRLHGQDRAAGIRQSQDGHASTLSAGDRARVDAKLQVGTVAESDHGDRRDAAAADGSSTVGTLVNGEDVQDLPVNGRNFVRLVQAVPGANEGLPNSLASGTRPDDRRQTSAISINGAGDNQNNQLIDGMDNNERAIGTIGVKPSIDAIAEIQGPDEQLHRRSRPHRGRRREHHHEVGHQRLPWLGVRVLPQRSVRRARLLRRRPKPLLKQNQFGGSLGGPHPQRPHVLLRRLRRLPAASRASPTCSTRPDGEMRAGDFSELPVTIYDPLTRRDAVPGQPDSGRPARSDRAAATWRCYPPTDDRRTGEQLRRRTTLRTQNSATADVRIDSGSTPTTRVRPLLVQQRRHASRRSACPADRGRDRPGCSGGSGFPGRTTPRPTARR